MSQLDANAAENMSRSCTATTWHEQSTHATSHKQREAELEEFVQNVLH